MTIVMPPGPVSCIGGTKYPQCIVLYCIQRPHKDRNQGVFYIKVCTVHTVRRHIETIKRSTEHCHVFF